MSEVTRCEQCGRIATRTGRSGWIYMGTRKPPEERGSYISRVMYGGPELPAWKDLCSWECVRDYAVLQALDPQLAKGEEPGT